MHHHLVMKSTVFTQYLKDCVCVHVGTYYTPVYAHVCSGMFAHVATLRKPKVEAGLSFLEHVPTSFFEIGSLTEPGAHHFG